MRKKKGFFSSAASSSYAAKFWNVSVERREEKLLYITNSIIRIVRYQNFPDIFSSLVRSLRNVLTNAEREKRNGIGVDLVVM
jgi:hypothetical protein